MIDEFLKESNRLKSFTIFDWPLKRNMHAKALAKAGFYYYGDADRVQCAFCNGILGDWEEDDLPSFQHRKYFPTCPFFRDPLDCGNIPLIERSRSSSKAPILLQDSFSTRKPVQPQTKKVRHVTFQLPSETSFENDLYPFSYRPYHVAMATYEKRLKSFNDKFRWPFISHTPVVPASHFAEAGFFYYGEEDIVCCFFCNGTLSRWLPHDDAWTEHAKWYPRCLFLLLVKGPDFVKKLTQQWTRPQVRFIQSENEQSAEVNKVQHLYNYDNGLVTRCSQI